MKISNKMIIVLIVTSLTLGCTSISRQLGKFTSNKYAEPRSGTVWVVAPPQLDPPSPAHKNVYISYRNISDADIDLLQEMKAAAREQGWRIVEDPTKARYRLRASLRYFGEVEAESGGADVASGLGIITGAAIGVAAYKRTGSGGTGMAIAGAGASLFEAGLSNASKPREWALIIDFVLEEYTSKPVSFRLSTGRDSAMDSNGGAAGSRSSMRGSESSNNSSGAEMVKKSNYFPHGIRLSVWSNQMNMKAKEALPHILKRTKKVITKLLPI